MHLSLKFAIYEIGMVWYLIARAIPDLSAKKGLTRGWQ